MQLLIQEILLRVTEANPGRKTGWEEVEQLPNRSWVRRFAERHNLVLRFGMIQKNINVNFRACSEISKGRQVIRPEDLAQWQQDTWAFLSSKLELKEALLDPDRVWNQDETAVELGCADQVFN